jgi:hypothetical protein
MGTSTVRLLQAASERAGGAKALAERLGITESTLAYFMADASPLPDPLLLRVVDIVLAEGLSPSPLVKLPGKSENNWDDGAATSGAGAAE